MKTIPLCLLVLLAPQVWARNEARMVVKNPDNSLTMLQVSRAEVTVRFTLDLAETEYLLTFYNDRDRDIEGEFTLPLPAGATVSNYALEVNGKMREGVAVEKARARTAYETVKRRMIDPGLVEREAGNIYRTRVYPIPARGTKQLRLRYIETLPADNHRLLYSLPLRFNGKVDAFVCRLTGNGLDSRAIVNPGGLGFRSDGPDCLLAELKNQSPDGVVQLALPQPVGPAMVVANPQEPMFYLRDVTPAIALRKRASPKKVHLTWDASGSGRSRNHQREFEVLDAWFRSIGNTSVELHLLRNEQSRVGSFQVIDGAWAKLRKTLETIHYDGATNLSAIDLPDDSSDIAIFVGDGIGSIGGLPSVDASRFIFLRSGRNAGPPDTNLIRLTTEPPVIDLDRMPLEEALRILTHVQLRLLEVRGTALGKYQADPHPQPGETLHVSGNLLDGNAGRLELVYGCEGMDPIIQTVEYAAPAEIPNNILGRIHAQRMLAVMESQPRPDIPALVNHCKLHGLVSDHTSFIVLERLEDYASHGIRPPEPELADAYEAEVARINQLTAAKDPKLSPFAIEWKFRMDWYQKRFPGYEDLILPRLRRVAIWKRAIESQFLPEWRDKESFSTIAAWHDDACKTIAGFNKLADTKGYLAWMAKIDELHQTGATLAKVPVKPPPPGTPLAVSVRGLVNQPGVLKQDGPLSLKQALDKAGGIHPSGTPGQIAIYRNASKTVYNTRSKEFIDPALLPCDMVVAETDYSDYAVDPFSEPIERPLEDQPAVRVDMALEDVAAGSSQPPSELRPESLTPSTNAEILIPAPPESPAPDMADFQKNLTANKDPEALYAAAAGADARPQSFYIEAGKLLFSAGHRQLAIRVWSNMLESRPGDLSAVRAMAWWLADAGLNREAQDLLESAGALQDPGSETLVLNTLALNADPENKPLDPAGLVAWKSGKLANIAAMHASPAHVAGMRVFSLPADLRIELHASDPQALIGFTVTSPDGTRSYTDSVDTHGGRTSGENGIHEYLCRKAMPGTYQIHCRSSHPCSVRLQIHTHWAKPGQQSRTVTLLLDDAKPVQVADVAIAFSPDSE
jgi:Vault protein inter-alpha-trypsin domain